MILDPPRFPERSLYRQDEIAALDPVEVLRLWVNGGCFHRYDPDPLKAELNIRAVLSEGRLSWYIGVCQYGTGRDGWCSGHSTVEIAAYAMLAMIETDEREAYEQALVIGVA